MLLFVVSMLMMSCGYINFGSSLQPGEYPVLVQLYKTSVDKMSLSTKVLQLIINNDYSAEVEVEWEARQEGYTVATITKFSDAGNENIYITDDLGNIYIQNEVSGAAAQDIVFSYSNVIVGRYKFPPINENAKILTFFDDSHGKSIEMHFR